MLKICEKIKMSAALVFIAALVHGCGLTKSENGRRSSTNSERFEGFSAFPQNLIRVAVPKSLLIIHLDENKEYNEIYSTKYMDCEYYIAEQDPDNREYIKINKNTNMLTSIPIDREDGVFSNMIVPQIQVKLQLDCPNIYTIQRSISNNEKFRDLPAKLGDRSYVLTSDIDFSPQTMMLSIIIEDVNDNKPEFIHPPNSNFLIGYPDAAISEDIFPDYLIKVKAIDKDIGLNAKIKYKIWPNDDFYINPETGEIYPFSSSMHNTEELCLKVYAVDRDGADDGKVSTVDIKVKKASAEHLALMTIKKENFEETQRTLETIRHRTGLNFKILKKSFVTTPLKRDLKLGEQKSLSNERPGRIVVLKCWIYAFDETGELMDSNLIETKVSEIGERLNTSVVSFRRAKHKAKEEYNNPNNESNITITLIIIVAVLLVLLISLIASFLCWYCVRFHKYKRMSTPSSSGTTISSISNEMEQHRVSIQDNGCSYLNYPFHKRDSLVKYQENGYRHTTTNKRNSILKGRSSLPESSEHFNKVAQRLHGILGDISEAQGYSPDLENRRIPPDRRKSSVTFNDNVQFFNIDIDDEDGEADTVTYSRL